MRIAVLFYGGVKYKSINNALITPYFIDDNLYHVGHTYINLLNTFGENNEYDFFLSINPELNEDLTEFIALYNPISICNDPIIYFDDYSKYKKAPETIIHNMICTFINKMRVYKLLEEHINKTNINYDLVISTRATIQYNKIFNEVINNNLNIPCGCDHFEMIDNKIQINNLNSMKKFEYYDMNLKNFVNDNENIIFIPYGYDYQGMCDRYAIGNVKSMKTYMNIYKDHINILDSECLLHPEILNLVYIHSKKLEVIRFNLNHDILRNNIIKETQNEKKMIFRFEEDTNTYIDISEIIIELTETQDILEYDDTITVISGIIKEEFVVNLINSYKYVKNKLISTWDDTEIKLLEELKNNGFKIILSNENDIKFKCSTNYQCVTINNGIIEAIKLGFKYVCRSRTDIFLTNHLKFLHLTRELYKEKITVLYGIEQGIEHGVKPDLIYYSDLIMCGTIHDMLISFNKQKEFNDNAIPEIFFLKNYSKSSINKNEYTKEEIKKYFNFVHTICIDNNIEILWYKTIFINKRQPYRKLVSEYYFANHKIFI